jgi:hypothetical protein
MHAEPIIAPLPTRATRRVDALRAFALMVLLTLAWIAADWDQLRYLTLPDTDDMMRLAQVRDWLAGQAFNDWTQYRLAGGAPMHWSRVNDLGLATLIVAATPLLGRASAELLAVLLYPALLFTAYLFLTARIGRQLWGPGAASAAMVLAALAYPAVGLFRPGRIDHHGLQIVLNLAAVLALTSAPLWRSGLAAGAAIAVSMVVGLESVPLVAGAMAALFGLWVWRGSGERERMLWFGAGGVSVTAVLLIFARPNFWSNAWCDAFTPASSSAMLIAGGLFVLLGWTTPRLQSTRARLLLGGIAGALALVWIVALYPSCLTGPYGPTNPFIRRAFIDNVIEAAGLLRGSPADAVASAGLMAAALVGGAWVMWGRPIRRARLLPAMMALAGCFAITFVQIRGAYLGSALAPAILAGVVLAARRASRWRAAALAGAWLASAGVVYALLSSHLAANSARATTALTSAACDRGDVWRQVGRYPAGVVMAPVDFGAYLIGGTHHDAVAATYHRNNRGNVAGYAFFLQPPERARAIGRAWNVRYVALCPLSFSELSVHAVYPASLASAMLSGRTPAWLEPLPLTGTSLRLYRVR